ncbi:MAG TPA: hypothetical protein VIE89_32535 [Candidatus Binatia bacterium]|jgi:hypothetical protein
MTEILLWQAINALLLVPVWIALLMLTRWMRGRPIFTERDWVFPVGHSREKILSLHFWLRLAPLWFTVVLLGVNEIYGLITHGIGLLLGAVLLTALAVLFFAPTRS